MDKSSPLEAPKTVFLRSTFDFVILAKWNRDVSFPFRNVFAHLRNLFGCHVIATQLAGQPVSRPARQPQEVASNVHDDLLKVS